MFNFNLLILELYSLDIKVFIEETQYYNVLHIIILFSNQNNFLEYCELIMKYYTYKQRLPPL